MIVEELQKEREGKGFYVLHAGRPYCCTHREYVVFSKVITIFRLNALNNIVYYISSKLNHSCQPNVYLTSDGQIIAIRDIQKGEELLISYLKRDSSLYKYQQLRAMEIQRTKFCFSCFVFFDRKAQCDLDMNIQGIQM